MLVLSCPVLGKPAELRVVGAEFGGDLQQGKAMQAAARAHLAAESQRHRCWQPHTND